MNPLRFLFPTLRRLLATLLFGLGVGLPLLPAADEPAAPDFKEQREVLEIDLGRLYQLIQQDNDPVTKTTLLGHQKELATRANRLLEKFDPAKYDELRYDINIQCQRLARKQAPLLTPPSSSQDGKVAEFALDELYPSPTDKAEVRAALEIVDLTIKRLEQRLGLLRPGSTRHRAEEARIKRLHERRAALAKDFTQSGWDALVGEFRATGS